MFDFATRYLIGRIIYLWVKGRHHGNEAVVQYPEHLTGQEYVLVVSQMPKLYKKTATLHLFVLKTH
jgi:hypothetical protein